MFWKYHEPYPSVIYNSVIPLFWEKLLKKCNDYLRYCSHHWRWETFLAFCFLSCLFSIVLVLSNSSESLYELSWMFIRTWRTLQFSYFMHTFRNFCQSCSMEEGNERRLHPVRWGFSSEQHCSSRMLLLDSLHVEYSLMVKCSSRGGCICEQALWLLSKTAVVGRPPEHDANKFLLVPVGGEHHWEHLRGLQL